MLRTGALDPHAEAMIHADLERISRQVDEHRATLDRMDKSPGAGYIAVEGARKPPAEPLPERQIPREQRGDPSHERFLAEHSALGKRYPDAQFLSVGEPWMEVKPEGKRIYRVLEVRNPTNDEVILRREEIRSLGADGKPIDHWVQRGSEGNVRGEIGEEGFRTEFEAEKAAGRRENQILLPNELIQLGGGQGFDGVIVKFDEHGRATVVLVEVKNYPNRYVPLNDITAINENLRPNLDRLKAMLANESLHERLGLTAEQAARAHDAISKSKLEFELRLGDTTRLGDVESSRSSVLRDLRADISAQLDGHQIPQSSVRAVSIEGEHMRVAERLVEAKERLGLGDARELRKLATGGDSTLTAEGIRRAEAALAVQKKMPAIVEKPLRVGAEAHTFLDKNNSPFKVFTPEKGTSATRMAAEVAQSLKATRSAPGKPARMIVDVTNLTPGQQKTLRRELQARANKRPKLDLDRVVIVDMSRGTAKPFTSLSK